jgi:hypothetical protein
MRDRKRLKIACTTSWTESEETFPTDMIVTRVRAIAGSPATQVALAFRETSNPLSALDVPLEYSLSASPLDTEESILVRGVPIRNSLKSKVWIAAKADAICVVEILIEYEANERT